MEAAEEFGSPAWPRGKHDCPPVPPLANRMPFILSTFRVAYVSCFRPSWNVHPRGNIIKKARSARVRKTVVILLSAEVSFVFSPHVTIRKHEEVGEREGLTPLTPSSMPKVGRIYLISLSDNQIGALSWHGEPWTDLSTT